MKIEILENFKHGRDQYLQGETRVVTEEDGVYFCSNGWAKDVDGKVATGDRDRAHGKVLEVQNLKHAVSIKTEAG